MQTIVIPGPIAPSLKGSPALENFWIHIWCKVMDGEAELTILDFSQVEEIDKITVVFLAILLGLCQEYSKRLVLAGIQGIKDQTRSQELRATFPCSDTVEAASHAIDIAAELGIVPIQAENPMSFPQPGKDPC